MKWLAAARLGMRWLQVMSTPMERRGTRRLMWRISCPWLLFASARLAIGRPTPKVLKMWRFVMLLLLFVLDSSSRFTKVAGALDRWRCSRCQRCARNNSTLLALRRTACEPLFGAGRLHRFRECTVSQGSAFWADHVVHHVWGIQLKPQLCAASTLHRIMRSQRLRQLVIGRHPITGAWLLDATQPL